MFGGKKMEEKKLTDSGIKKRIKDLSGEKFGMLTILKFSHTKNNRSYWLCHCDCGKNKIVSANNLKYGTTKACGCLKNKGYFCGETIKNKTERLYKVYRSMVNRCYYPNQENYKNYGGRGITVCENWLKSYKSFRDWAYANGYDETAEFGKCTIDRINVNGNYEPSNCRWVSMKEQLNNYSRNVLITANGITLNVQQWAKRLGVNNATLRSRLKRGWTDEKIINTPLQKRPWR